MGRFCSEECREVGSVCDFCKNYKDNGVGVFSGSGICSVDNTDVFAMDGYSCKDYVCSEIKE